MRLMTWRALSISPYKADILRRGGSGEGAFHSIDTPYESEVFRYIPDEQLLPFVPSSAAQAGAYTRPLLTPT
jgi:hypothetical protein